MKRFINSIFLFLLFIQVYSQVKVESNLSSVEMLVGQQVELNICATTPQGSHVEFPKEGLIPAGIEFLGAIEKEPETIEDGRVRHSRSYVLTSFEDTLYYLPPFVVKVDGKEYKTNKLALKVLTVDVDTTNYEKYYGPKSVQDNPFMWSGEWSAPFWLSFIIIILFSITYYLYLRLRDNKPIIAKIKIVKRVLPHQKAMMVIEEIKADKMVMAEDPKDYYTKLTDTLRKYIEERYGFNAMEMTSQEIIERLMSTDDPKSLEELKQLFNTADLVKFAKYSTLINENDANLVNAVDFINQTKVEIPESQSTIKEQLTTEEIRSKNSRLALQITISVLCTLLLLLFGYVLYCVYELI
ncbi:hypothetical protein [Xylanibacter brevis]|uniref:hypothetical protein n=1 Tax=Xylanibacter brevis TaxID=83231 RepID=UPI0004811CC8|nr:hypothetical protein [Xylanibacter brevis]